MIDVARPCNRKVASYLKYTLCRTSYNKIFIFRYGVKSLKTKDLNKDIADIL